MPSLKNQRHERFCQALVRGETAGNLVASYAKVYGADPSKTHVRSAASRLNQREDISKRVAELQAQVNTIETKATERAIEKLAVTKENVLAELAKIGFANMLDYVQPTAEGDVVVDLSALDRDKAAAVQEVIIDTYQDGRGENSRDVKRVRFKLADKRAALVDLGKHLGMFVERRHVTNEFDELTADELDRRISELERELGSDAGGAAQVSKTATPPRRETTSKPH